MKTTWFITVAALSFSGLAAAQNEGRTAASSAASTASPFTISAPNWMDQNLKVKTGRYSPTEETRQADARASTAFRDASPAVAQLGPIDQHYLAKRGRLPGR